MSRERVGRHEGVGVQSILVAYDGSEHSRRALERAAELAKDGATVTVISVVEVGVTAGRGPVLVDPDEAEERRHDLDEAVAFLSDKGIEARAIEGHGDPGEAIAEEAGKAGADLVVVGTRGRNVAARLLLGSVSTKVVQRAPCDVLVVR